MNTENADHISSKPVHDESPPGRSICVHMRSLWLQRISLCLCVSVVSVLFTAAGCASAVSTGQSASLSGDDLRRITDDMAMKLAGDPDVRAAISAEGALPIVVLPVENRMTGEILPRGPAMAYTARVRTLLAQKAPTDFTWIVNRDEFNALRARELSGVDLGPSPDAIQPRYALHARFQTLTNDTRDARSIYYLCVYELTDITNRKSLWTGSYELKKAVVKGFLD